MSLPQAYFLLAALYALAAGALAFAPGAVRAFPRSHGAATVLFGAASVWFISLLWHVGEADLAGIPRPLVLGAFGASALAAFKLLPEFLAVRGLAGLLLLTASPLLDAGFGKTPQSLLLASLTYVLILGSIVIGTAPYLLRDLIGASLATPRRTRLTIGVTSAAAAGCLINGLLI